MDYNEWADEYYLNALRIKSVIGRKQQQLNGSGLTADARKKLTDDIKAYRRIYYELTQVGDLLRVRAGAAESEA